MRVNFKAAAEFKRNDTAKDRLRALANATPEQIDAYVDTNVTDLASAKTVLKTLLLAVSALMSRL